MKMVAPQQQLKAAQILLLQDGLQFLRQFIPREETRCCLVCRNIRTNNREYVTWSLSGLPACRSSFPARIPGTR